MVASALAMLTINRVVAPAEYGRVAVIVATWSLLLTPITWCGGLVMRFGPVELEQRRSLAVTIATRAVFALPVLAVVSIVGPLWLGCADHWPTILLTLTVGWLLVSTLHNVMQWSATAAQAFRATAIANVFLKGTPLVLTGTALLHSFTISAEMLLTSMLIGLTCATAVFAFALKPYLGVARPDRALLRSMWRYSLPGLLGMPALAVIAWADPVLLSHWASDADVGRYQLAYPVITICAVLGASVNVVFSPELVRAETRGDSSTLERYKRREQPRVALFMATAAFGAACFTTPLIKAILSPSYAQTSEIFSLLAVAGGFVLATYTMYPLVTATDSVWSMQAASVLQAAANITFDVVLAPRYGAPGIAIANILAWGIGFSALSLMLRRTIRLPLTSTPIILLGGALVAVLLALEISLAVRLCVGGAFLLLSGFGAARFVRHRGGGRQI